MLRTPPTRHLPGTSVPTRITLLCNETVVLLRISENAYMKTTGLMARQPRSGLRGYPLFLSAAWHLLPLFFSFGEGTSPQFLEQMASMSLSLGAKKKARHCSPS